ncbi:murein DD-endopeptidase MepM/ murein hydrolase activator NlpD [Aurantimicrobium minutum]|uniref:M23 family metallopeptidase n=1 Tax=Aurantimicrobium minutum TaxID=708131 RepID=UPI002476D1FF|nr:M23 family metallopeptidase [Aurantimicrobium minutum]MDH6531945.1 murein DD-endopeptidase MepM/ murein hydrolase activator NlpD [Aurantimicrobium minutum]
MVDEHDETAALQQSRREPTEQPLTRRQLRDMRQQESDEVLAQELERQVLSYRPVAHPAEEDSSQVAIFSDLSESREPLERAAPQPTPVVTPVVSDPVPLSRRELRNAALPAEQTLPAVPVDVPAVPFDQQDVVFLPASDPATGPIPAPIALMAQVSTPSPPKPHVKVRIRHKSRKQVPAVVAPKKRKGGIARIFTLTAMAFVAGLAIATSIPANALLSPEDVALMAEQSRLSTLPIGDGQSVEGTGENLAAGRDGVSVTSAQIAPTSGAYSVKKLAVNVPISNNGVQWPVKEVKISSPFGDRNLFGYYNFHTGLDFSHDYGTPIYSVADGIVSLVEDPGPTCGVSIFIEHNVDGTKFTSVYCHMVPGSPPFKAGDTVNKGDLVGNIGLTGLTTGPHLHLEIRVGDSPIDPYTFLVQRAGKSPTESAG